MQNTLSQELQPHLGLLSFPQGRDFGWSVFFNLSWLKSFFHDARQEWRVLGVKV